METPTTPHFSKRKIVVVAAFFVLLGVGCLIGAAYLRQTEGYWRVKLLAGGIGDIVIFGIALVQGLVFLFSKDHGKKS